MSTRSVTPPPTLSTRSSVGTSLTTPTLHPEVLEPPMLHIMARGSSDQSSAADSILDSYADYHSKLVERAPTPADPVGRNLETKNLVQPSIRPRSIKCRTHRDPTTGLEPVIELIQDQTTKSYDQTANLSDQVMSLQTDIQMLPATIASALNRQGSTNEVLKMVAKLEEQTQSNEKLFDALDSKIDRLAAHYHDGSSIRADNGKLVTAIQTLRSDVMEDLTHIRSALGSKIGTTVNQTEVKNVAPLISQPQAELFHPQLKIEEHLAAFKVGEHVPSAKCPQIEVRISFQCMA
ncbi:hypothetical protein H0H87_010134 [Tephrocybe sp. NHM501043]|nr:hypothetical protein H0H87_010134 [Tephrocybe sp. NHM501043]